MAGPCKKMLVRGSGALVAVCAVELPWKHGAMRGLYILRKWCLVFGALSACQPLGAEAETATPDGGSAREASSEPEADAPAAGAADSTNDGSEPETWPASPDAETGALGCPTSARGLGLGPDAIAAYGGTLWQWSSHHYVANGRSGEITLSEIWWPWMLPGDDDVIYSTSAPFRSGRLRAPRPSWISERPMVVWTGTARRGVLLSRAPADVAWREVHLLDGARNDLRLVARLPVDPRLPRTDRPTREEQRNPPHSFAGLLVDAVVWLAENGDLWSTRLSDGVSSVIQAATGAEVLVASRNRYAWRENERVVVDTEPSSGRRTFSLGVDALRTRQALAMNDETLFVGVGDVVNAIPLSNPSDAERSWRVEGEVARIAVDACFLYVTYETATGRRLWARALGEL